MLAAVTAAAPRCNPACAADSPLSRERRTGSDAYLKRNAARKRTHSLFRQGACWYGATPETRDDWRANPMSAFEQIVSAHAVFRQLCALLRGMPRRVSSVPCAGRPAGMPSSTGSGREKPAFASRRAPGATLSGRSKPTGLAKSMTRRAARPDRAVHRELHAMVRGASGREDQGLLEQERARAIQGGQGSFATRRAGRRGDGRTGRRPRRRVRRARLRARIVPGAPCSPSRGYLGSETTGRTCRSSQLPKRRLWTGPGSSPVLRRVVGSSSQAR